MTIEQAKQAIEDGAKKAGVNMDKRAVCYSDIPRILEHALDGYALRSDVAALIDERINLEMQGHLSGHVNRLDLWNDDRTDLVRNIAIGEINRALDKGIAKTGIEVERDYFKAKCADLSKEAERIAGLRLAAETDRDEYKAAAEEEAHHADKLEKDRDKFMRKVAEGQADATRLADTLVNIYQQLLGDASHGQPFSELPARLTEYMDAKDGQIAELEKQLASLCNRGESEVAARDRRIGDLSGEIRNAMNAYRALSQQGIEISSTSKLDDAMRHLAAQMIELRNDAKQDEQTIDELNEELSELKETAADLEKDKAIYIDRFKEAEKDRDSLRQQLAAAQNLTLANAREYDKLRAICFKVCPGEGEHYDLVSLEKALTELVAQLEQARKESKSLRELYAGHENDRLRNELSTAHACLISAEHDSESALAKLAEAEKAKDEMEWDLQRAMKDKVEMGEEIGAKDAEIERLRKELGHFMDITREDRSAPPPAPEKAGPRIVCLCGSTRFKDAYTEAMKSETLSGAIVLTVGIFGHVEGLDMNGPTKAMLDELHKRKIDLADEVLILNVGGYIGESTRSELEYAQAHGKTVRYLVGARADAGTPCQPASDPGKGVQWMMVDGILRDRDEFGIVVSGKNEARFATRAEIEAAMVKGSQVQWEDGKSYPVHCEVGDDVIELWDENGQEGGGVIVADKQDCTLIAKAEGR